MAESPRIRRLRSDFRAMQQLDAESSVLQFQASKSRFGTPPESYLVHFIGRGIYKSESDGLIRSLERHTVSLQLSGSYPRTIPEMQWRSQIYHPNISASGVVCLGGYTTHWVPSLGLDDLCQMLWDMIRYENFDTESPYNREAAHWAKTQTDVRFPLDPRPLRDKRLQAPPAKAARPQPETAPDVVFLDSSPSRTAPRPAPRSSEVVDAEIVEAREDPDILFMD